MLEHLFLLLLQAPCISCADTWLHSVHGGDFYFYFDEVLLLAIVLDGFFLALDLHAFGLLSFAN